MGGTRTPDERCRNQGLEYFARELRIPTRAAKRQTPDSARAGRHRRGGKS